MGIKERMMDGMMDKMSAEEKQKAMEGMMENFLGSLSSEERGRMMEGMMEKFLGGMSEAERGAMMSRMMPRMMGSMMGGEGMMGMMGRMMGGGMRSEAGRLTESGRKSAESEGAGEMPWDMCRKMMGAMTEGTQTARFATPEVRGLFDEWAAQIEEEMLQFTTGTGEVDVQKTAEHFRLSKESTIYFLTRLAQKGKIEFGKKS